MRKVFWDGILTVLLLGRMEKMVVKRGGELLVLVSKHTHACPLAHLLTSCLLCLAVHCAAVWMRFEAGFRGGRAVNSAEACRHVLFRFLFIFFECEVKGLTPMRNVLPKL